MFKQVTARRGNPNGSVDPSVVGSRSWPDRLYRAVYAGYVWLALLVVGVFVWPFVSISPCRRLNWSVTRAAGFALARLSGISFTMTGVLPADGAPSVIVANHASFIDGMVFILVAPSPVAIVAGGELATQRLAGPFLRGLGCEFVLSGDDRPGRSNADRYAQALAAGRSLAIFPEASLGNDPGIRRFHLGAFAIAAQAEVPVIPIGICGTREVTPPGRRLPVRGNVQAHVGAPILADGTGMAPTLALRNEVRLVILQLTGKQDLLDHRQ